MVTTDIRTIEFRTTPEGRNAAIARLQAERQTEYDRILRQLDTYRENVNTGGRPAPVFAAGDRATGTRGRGRRHHVVVRHRAQVQADSVPLQSPLADVGIGTWPFAVDGVQQGHICGVKHRGKSLKDARASYHILKALSSGHPHPPRKDTPPTTTPFATRFSRLTEWQRYKRLLMRYAPEDDAQQPATQTLTGGCAGECYGWRRYDDPSVGGCEKATCERLRQQPQPEPNQDTR